MRSTLHNAKSPKDKSAKSQSPLTKKKLFKFVNQNFDPHEKTVQYQPKNDTFQQPIQEKKSSKVTDFKQEIERRFKASKSNREYVFPRRNSYADDSDDSIASIKNVQQYDLHTQNFKRKIEKRASPKPTENKNRPNKRVLTTQAIDPIIKKKEKIQEQKLLKKGQTIGEDEQSPLSDQLSNIPSLEIQNDATGKHIPLQTNFEAKMPKRAETPQYSTANRPSSSAAEQRQQQLQKNPKPSSKLQTNPSNRYSGSFKNKREVEQHSLESSRLKLQQASTELYIAKKSTNDSNKTEHFKQQLSTNHHHTSSAKTINVKLNLNMTSPQKPDFYESKTTTDRGQTSTPGTTATTTNSNNKKSILSINNYGTVNNIINYNIYPSSQTGTLQPNKSSKELSIQVTMPLKSSQSTSNLHPTTSQSTRNSDQVATKLTARSHQQGQQAAYQQSNSLKASTVSTNDKSLQSFKSSIHSNMDVVQKNNYVTPKVQKTPTALTLSSKSQVPTSSSKVVKTEGSTTTTREPTRSSENQKTQSLYRKTQQDLLLKKSKATPTAAGTSSMQTKSPGKGFGYATSSSYFPQTARSLTKSNSTYLSNGNLIHSPMSKMISPKVSTLKNSTSSANLKAASKVMTHSLTAINQSGRTSANLKKANSKPSSTQKQRPDPKMSTHTNMSSLNKSNSELKTSHHMASGSSGGPQFTHLNKLILNSESSRLSLNIQPSTQRNSGQDKPKMRLDLRQITKSSKGIYSDRSYHPLKSDRKDKSSEYY